MHIAHLTYQIRLRITRILELDPLRLAEHHHRIIMKHHNQQVRSALFPKTLRSHHPHRRYHLIELHFRLWDWPIFANLHKHDRSPPRQHKIRGLVRRKPAFHRVRDDRAVDQRVQEVPNPPRLHLFDVVPRQILHIVLDFTTDLHRFRRPARVEAVLDSQSAIRQRFAGNCGFETFPQCQTPRPRPPARFRCPSAHSQI